MVSRPNAPTPRMPGVAQRGSRAQAFAIQDSVLISIGV